MKIMILIKISKLGTFYKYIYAIQYKLISNGVKSHIASEMVLLRHRTISIEPIFF